MVSATPMLARRAFATEAPPPPPKEEKSSAGLWIGLGGAALAAAATYYVYSQDGGPSFASVSKEHTKEDYEKVYQAIADTLEKEGYDDGSLAPVVLRLAWHASGTYDKDDKTGGSNHATMRFEKESSHGANAGLDTARAYLETVKKQFPWISYGDLWTLAGVCAIQEMGGPSIPWRPGRVDGFDNMQTPDGRLPDATQGQDHLRKIFYRMGFNDQEIVALSGAHALGRCHVNRSGFDGPWTFAPTSVTNEFYNLLLNDKWQWRKWKGPDQYEDVKTKSLMMLPTDMSLVKDKEFKKWVQAYAKDEDLWFKDFSKAINTLFELGVPTEQFKQGPWKMEGIPEKA